MNQLFRFPEATRYSTDIEEWLSGEPRELFGIARDWFAVFRRCGEDVNELIHDGCPVACVGDAAFGYVNVFRTHVNVGFYAGASLPDPRGLLEGNGKRMRHVKVKPGDEPDTAALTSLIESAYRDMKRRLG